MDSAKSRYPILGQSGRARVFWFLVFIGSAIGSLLVSGGITWFLILMTILVAVGSIQLLRSQALRRGEIGYAELDQDGLVVHLRMWESYITYSDLEAASYRGRMVELQFNHALPIGPLPIYGFYRRSLKFRVNEAESLVGVLNARIVVQHEAHSN